MSIFAEAAQRLAEAAAALEDRAAMDICEAQAITFQAVLRSVTPEKTGALRDSETIDDLSGGGSHAHAAVAPHEKYAEIRNDGGTITAHAGLGKKGKRPHTLHWDGGGFPLSVKQHGTGYVQKAQADAQGPCRQAAQMVLDAYLGDIF